MDFDGDLPSGYVKIAMFMLDVDGGFLMDFCWWILMLMDFDDVYGDLNGYIFVL